MKIKPTPVYFLCFFSLVFLIHEVHDWAHYITAWMVCGCPSKRAFDSWAACKTCPASTTGVALATMIGPLVNYLVIWVGWGLMQPDNPQEKQSIGFSMVFAALPFPRMMGALAGGGDETSGLRQLFQRPDGSNHYVVAASGLLMVTALCLPALIRAFFLVTGWVQRAILLPAFLVLPSVADHWTVHVLLNKLLAYGVLARPVLRGGAQLFLFVWLVVMLVVYLSTWRSQEEVLEYKEVTV